MAAKSSAGVKKAALVEGMSCTRKKCEKGEVSWPRAKPTINSDVKALRR